MLIHIKFVGLCPPREELGEVTKSAGLWAARRLACLWPRVAEKAPARTPGGRALNGLHTQAYFSCENSISLKTQLSG